MSGFQPKESQHGNQPNALYSTQTKTKSTNTYTDPNSNDTFQLQTIADSSNESQESGLMKFMQNGFDNKGNNVEQGEPKTPPTPMYDKIGSMNYYKLRHADFVERNPGKSPPEYYLNYGDKYINRFTHVTRDKLSPQGKKWLDKALINLQRAIEVRLTFDPYLELDNDAFKNFAFKSHVGAYESAGVLNLSVMDKVQIVLTPDPWDLFSKEGIEQALQVGYDQAKVYAKNPLFAYEQIREAIDNREEILELVQEYYEKNKDYFNVNNLDKDAILELIMGPLSKYLL